VTGSFSIVPLPRAEQTPLGLGLSSKFFLKLRLTTHQNLFDVRACTDVTFNFSTNKLEKYKNQKKRKSFKQSLKISFYCFSRALLYFFL